MSESASPGFRHEKWSSGTVFMLATIGAAVGLGNLWRFPFIAGQNGGSAFVLIYLGFVFGLGIPVMLAELAMGRRGGGSPVASMRALVAEAGKSRFWTIIGWISILVPLLGLAYYGIVGGWSIDYVWRAAANRFAGMDGAAAGAEFDALVGSPLRLLVFHGLFIALGVVVVARGVGKGIEAVCRYMMPALFVILVVLAINAVFNADIAAGMDFLFNPRWDLVTVEVVLMAMGQAFFSLAIGVGVMLTYGAYVPGTVSLRKAAFTIAMADTLVAILAGIAIFPVVFASGLDPADGPGLIFVTLPVAFGNMPFGYLVGVLFFVLLFFAAYSSLLGMLEPIVSYLEEHRGWSRPLMTILTGSFCWALGILAALSFNIWSDVRPAAFLPFLADKNFFALFDYLVANVLLPLNALLIAVFAGWMLPWQTVIDELDLSDPRLRRVLQVILKFVAPVLIATIFYQSLTG